MLQFLAEAAEHVEHASEVATAFRDVSWVIPVLPFVAAALILFFGKRTPGKGAPIGILGVAAGLVVGLGSFFEAIRDTHTIVEHSLNWISFGNFELELGMRVDTMASMMFVVVCFVSLLVQIYSTSYMHGEVRYTWYFVALNLFTGSMLLLVIANNTLQMLVGWEGVGVCSYLLIGHYFEEKENSSAAMKAFITTRFGDLGFVLGIITLFVGAGTFNIGELNELAAGGELSVGLMTVGGILLFMGAMGKSAQFPLHVWLPDAMAGPTPVSALIHAATMVAAGVYMVGRLYPIFLHSATALRVIAIAASITMLMAAAQAAVARDIKKVLAYSTVSQLAYMMAAMAVGGGTAGVFHLWTHAFFKALLFLGAGSVIHAVHTNDMFEMGGLKKFMPVTYWTFLLGTLALCGIFPFAGFWSKDEILASALHGKHYVVLVCAIATAFLTAFYMSRAFTLTFFGSYRRMPIAGGAHDDHHAPGGADEHAGEHDDHGHGHHGLPHESGPAMKWPLIILAFLSCTVGLLGVPGVGPFKDWIHFEGTEHGEFVMWLAVLSTIIAVFAIWLGYRMYSKAVVGFGVVDPLAKLGFLYRAAVRRFYIDDFYLACIVKPIQYPIAKFVYRVLDQKMINGVVNGAAMATVAAGKAARKTDETGIDGVVNGLAWITDRLSGALRRIQSGNIQYYAVALFVGVAVLAAVLFR